MIEDVDTVLLSAESKGEIKDGIEAVIEKNKRAEEKLKKRMLEKEAEEKLMAEETEKEAKRLKKAQSRNKWVKFLLSLKTPFLPSTWINILRYYEDLLYVTFLDAQIILVLFSLLYIVYIIVTFTGDKLVEGIFKISGCALICLIIIIVQVFTPTSKKEE